ncbi:MAG: hypothetical protein V4618_16685 [Pseudomonadota bacterium]
MEPERRKEIIKTVLFAAVFILFALVLLDMAIGDPSQIPTPTEP